MDPLSRTTWRPGTPLSISFNQYFNQYLFSELQYTLILNNKYVHITSTNDI